MEKKIKHILQPKQLGLVDGSVIELWVKGERDSSNELATGQYIRYQVLSSPPFPTGQRWTKYYHHVESGVWVYVKQENTTKTSLINLESVPHQRFWMVCPMETDNDITSGTTMGLSHLVDKKGTTNTFSEKERDDESNIFQFSIKLLDCQTTMSLSREIVTNEELIDLSPLENHPLVSRFPEISTKFKHQSFAINTLLEKMRKIYEYLKIRVFSTEEWITLSNELDTYDSYFSELRRVIVTPLTEAPDQIKAKQEIEAFINAQQAVYEFEVSQLLNKIIKERVKLFDPDLTLIEGLSESQYNNEITNPEHRHPKYSSSDFQNTSLKDLLIYIEEATFEIQAFSRINKQLRPLVRNNDHAHVKTRGQNSNLEARINYELEQATQITRIELSTLVIKTILELIYSKEFSDNYSSSQIALLTEMRSQLEQQVRDLETQLEDATSNSNTNKSAIKNAEAAIQNEKDLRAKLEVSEALLHRKEGNFVSMQAEYEREKERLLNRIHELETKSFDNSLNLQSPGLNLESMTALTQEIERLTQENNQLKDRLNLSEDETNSPQTSRVYKELQKKLDNCINLKSQIEEEIVGKDLAIEKLTNQYTELLQTVEKNTVLIQNQSREISDLTVENNNLSKELAFVMDQNIMLNVEQARTVSSLKRTRDEEISSCKLELGNVKQQKDELQAKLQHAESELKKLSLSPKNKIQIIRRENADLNVQLNLLSIESKNYSELYKRAQTEKDLLRSSAEYMTKMTKSLQSERITLRKRLVELEQEKEEVVANNNLLNQTLSQTSANETSLKYENSLLRKEVDRLKANLEERFLLSDSDVSQAEDNNCHNSSLNETINNLKDENLSLLRKESRLQAEILDLKIENDELSLTTALRDKKNEELINQRNDSNSLIQNLYKEIDDSNQIIKEKKEALEKLTNEVFQLNKRLTESRSNETEQANRIHDLEVRLQQFNASGHSIRSDANANERIRRELTDLKDTYETLIESARRNKFQDLTSSECVRNIAELQETLRLKEAELIAKTERISTLEVEVATLKDDKEAFKYQLERATNKLNRHKKENQKQKKLSKRFVFLSNSENSSENDDKPLVDKKVSESKIKSDSIPQLDGFDEMYFNEDSTELNDECIIENPIIGPELIETGLVLGSGYGILPSSGVSRGFADRYQVDVASDTSSAPSSPGADESAREKNTQKVLAVQYKAKHRITETADLIKTEIQVSNLTDSELSNFVNYDALKKHGMKYKEAIKDISTDLEQALMLIPLEMDPETERQLLKTQEKLQRTINKLKTTSAALHKEAESRQITEGIKKLDISSKVDPPSFSGPGIYPHFFEFKHSFHKYCRATQVNPSNSTVLRSCLTGEAEKQVDQTFQSVSNVTYSQVMECLKNLYGDPRTILSDIIHAHSRVQQITGTEKPSELNKRVLEHITLMDKVEYLLEDNPDMLQYVLYCEEILSCFPVYSQQSLFNELQRLTSFKDKFDHLKKSFKQSVNLTQTMNSLHRTHKSDFRVNGKKKKDKDEPPEEQSFVTNDNQSGHNYDLRSKTNQDNNNSNQRKRDYGGNPKQKYSNNKNRDNFNNQKKNDAGSNERRDHGAQNFKTKNHDNRQRSNDDSSSYRRKEHRKDIARRSYNLSKYEDKHFDCPNCRIRRDKSLLYTHDRMHAVNSRGNIETDSCPQLRELNTADKQKILDAAEICLSCTYRAVKPGHLYANCDHTTKYNFTKCQDDDCKIKFSFCGKHRELNLGNLQKRAKLYESIGMKWSFYGAQVVSSQTDNLSQSFHMTPPRKSIDRSKLYSDMKSLQKALGTDKIDPAQEGVPQFVFQTMEGLQGQDVIVGFDSASHHSIITDAALGTLIPASPVTKSNESYTQVQGIGGVVTLENCQILIQGTQGRYQMVLAHVIERLFDTGSIDMRRSINKAKTLGLPEAEFCYIPPWSPVSLLLGKNAVKFHPQLVYQSDSGLCIYKSIIKSPFNKGKSFNYCLGGLITEFDRIERENSANFLMKLQFDINNDSPDPRDFFSFNACTNQSEMEEVEMSDLSSRFDSIEMEDNHDDLSSVNPDIHMNQGENPVEINQKEFNHQVNDNDEINEPENEVALNDVQRLCLYQLAIADNIELPSYQSFTIHSPQTKEGDELEELGINHDQQDLD